MIFKLGELFSGPGGLSSGAISSSVKNHKGYVFKIKHGWASDYDEDSCRTYKMNIPCTKNNSVINQDVRTLDISKLTNIDAFAYGFPCNDFSLVGKQKGFNGKFGNLYSYGIQVINTFNPRFFVAENVGGLSSANGGKAFKQIIKELENSGKNGYNIQIHKYRSEQYGIPQTRHRIIIVGINKSEKIKFKIPAPTTPNKNSFITAREALENPPLPQNATNNELTRQSSLVIERLKKIKPGQNVWNADLPPRLQLNVKGAKLSQIYRRLDPNKPSYTITGSGGGGTHCYHYDQPRALTNRERARIQTFPDSYQFMGSKESVRKQIGMAVPPKLSGIIFEAVLKSFANIEYEHIVSNVKYC